MNVLILGSGGREHAFAHKIKQSPLCNNLFVAPGNSGTSELATNLNIQVDEFSNIESAIIKHKISLVVVGPEVPLVNGFHDFISNNEKLSNVSLSSLAGFIDELFFLARPKFFDLQRLKFVL